MKAHNYLKALHYFVVTAKHLSIKQAAESLFVTQAAISQQIRLLEEALGVTLFHRHHRALSLTPQGLQLLPPLELAFESIEQGVNQFTADTDPNTLTLSVFPSFASRWLIPRLVRFYELNPSISINLSMTDKYEAFRGQNGEKNGEKGGGAGIDLAIRFGSGEYDGLQSQFLMKDYIYPVCHPRYVDEHNIAAVEQLNQLRLLDDTVNNISWDYWFDKRAIEKPLGPDGKPYSRVRYDGSHYVVDSALSAQGVAMARHSLVAEQITNQQLVRLFGEPVELDGQFFLCAPKHHFDFPKIQLFSEWLIKEINEFCTTNPI